MKAPAFRYHAPRTIADAIALMSHLANARVLAGGQSLMPMMNLRVAGPDHLVDLGRIAELSGIEEDERGLSIGAMTSQRTIEKSTLVAAACPLLAEAIAHVGHQQTRNRGTIGGSLCHLDPGAELPVVAAALDAVLTVAGPRGSRQIAFRDFPADYLTSSLEADEILTRIHIPRQPPRTGAAFLEFNRRPADFAILSVATTLTIDASGHIAGAAIAIGGASFKPIRLDHAEATLADRLPDAAAFAEAAAIAASLPCDGDDLYPAAYRQDLCAVLVRRALTSAALRAGENDHV
ncbi:MAG: molybdopterin dehydrogenase [Hyphomicrobiales bacterium]|nr:molybdopterin dehydrogenase [Hyphomicrobiales bacterium]